MHGDRPSRTSEREAIYSVVSHVQPWLRHKYDDLETVVIIRSTRVIIGRTHVSNRRTKEAREQQNTYMEICGVSHAHDPVQDDLSAIVPIEETGNGVGEGPLGS